MTWLNPLQLGHLISFILVHLIGAADDIELYAGARPVFVGAKVEAIREVGGAVVVV